ncbi:MAG: hypothetical protein J1F16_01905 [Muribaculaceae bacterium]|nr:hypothetical protein [Muribaculaceae bacterium]
MSASTKITLLTFLLCSLFLSGCKDDYFELNDSYSEEVTVKFTVGMEKSVATRSQDFSVVGPGDYLWAENHPMIGDGTRAHYLTYALYEIKPDGSYLKVPTPDAEGKKSDRHTIYCNFPYDEIPEFTVAKDKDYVMVFWAQGQGDEVRNTYYNVDELQNINARYDTQELEEDQGSGMLISSVGQLNNMDARDVFCASHRFNVNNISQNINIVLHRAVAQVNIGFTKEAWQRLHDNNIDIKQSSISIAQVARRIDLVNNTVVLNTDEDINQSTSYTLAGFSKFRIPEYMEFEVGLNGMKEEMDYEGNRSKYCQRLFVGEEEYIWASMSYVLSAGAFNLDAPDSEAFSTVDIIDIGFYDAEGNDLGLPFKKLYNVPVRRNYRTNIILDEYLNADISVDMQISPDVTNDFNYDEGMLVEGELAPGLSYKINNISNWGLKPGIDFFVSSAHGLKWLADRSNGFDFIEEDIPTWIDKDGTVTTYPAFSSTPDGKNPDLEVYENFVYNLIAGRATLNGGVSEAKFRRNSNGYRVPWSYDHCRFLLVNDIDFALAEPYVREGWIGFSSNLSYIGNDLAGNLNWDWYNGKINTGPNEPLAFKGAIDGQGYTIYNMKIDNRKDFYDPFAEKKTNNHITSRRKLNNAGLVCTGGGGCTIKNLRLYNANIISDWNVGGFVGYYKQSDGGTLLIENCKLENSMVESTDGEFQSPSDDANVGGIAGSLPSEYTIVNTSVINSVIKSGYIGALFTGISSGRGSYKNCVVANCNLIHTEYNKIGTITGKVPNTRKSSDDVLRILIGQDSYDNKKDEVKSAFTVYNNIENEFYGIKYFNNSSISGNESLYGKSEVKDLRLDLFPEISTMYAQNIILASHILGSPSVVNGNVGYGIKVDATTQPERGNSKLTNKRGGVVTGNDGWIFTLAGNKGASLETGNNPIVNVRKDALDKVYGFYFTGDDEGKNEIQVSDIILTGLPTIDYGLFFNKVKMVRLYGVSVYDVMNTISDVNVPDGAEFYSDYCDFRGLVNIGNGYSKVIFNKTVFNIGSGHKDNMQGILDCKSNAEFTDCFFRNEYKIKISKGVSLRLKGCSFGPPSLVEFQSKKILEKYLDTSILDYCTISDPDDEGWITITHF